MTRDSEWTQPINPWTQKDRLPLLRGGLLAELIYGDQPRIIDDLQVSDGDPGAPFLEGQRSLMAIPLFEEGVALNMVVFLQKEPCAFRHDELPEYVWMSNLFGRATHNLVLAKELRSAYAVLDRELETIAQMQRSLLPPKLPDIATLFTLDAVAGLPLGIAEQQYEESTHSLKVGDQMVFYTDGITEATDPGGEMFGTERLDATLACGGMDAAGLIADVLGGVHEFTRGEPAHDDRTVLVAKVR
ncbi:MAG: PP2C family protein-serine/threonine phosphatase [Phycisphaerae bacterium]